MSVLTEIIVVVIYIITGLAIRLQDDEVKEDEINLNTYSARNV